MSAPVTTTRMQNCLRTAIAMVVERLGVSRAAIEMGIDPSTTRRHLAGTAWADNEIAALIAYECQEFGRSTIVDALCQVAHGESPSGESTRLRADLMEEVALGAQVIQAAAETHDHPTAQSLQNLQDLLDKRDCADVRLRADITAAKARA